MKIIYKNVAQIIRTLEWQKKSKTTNDARCLVLDSCANLQEKTKFVGKVKILTNTSGESSCSVFLGVGANDNTDNITGFLINNTPLDLTVGTVTELSGTIAITAAQVTNDYDVKVGIVGASGTINLNLMYGVTYEVEYYFV